MVVVKNSDDTFSLYLIELRNVKRPSGVRVREIKPKFETTIEDFMKVRFCDIFDPEKHTISKFYLWLIASPQNDMTDEKYERFMRSQLVEQYLLMKPLRFGKHKSTIQPTRPRPIIS